MASGYTLSIDAMHITYAWTQTHIDTMQIISQADIYMHVSYLTGYETNGIRFAMHGKSTPRGTLRQMSKM